MNDLLEADPVARFQDLRSRVLKGEDVSPEEYKVVVDGLREHRKSAATSRTKKRSTESGESGPQIDLEGWLKGNAV